MTFGRRTADASPTLRVVPNSAAHATADARQSAAAPADSSAPWIGDAKIALLPVVREKITAQEAKSITRGALAARINDLVQQWVQQKQLAPDPLQERDLVTYLINAVLGTGKGSAIPVAQQGADGPRPAAPNDPIEDAKERIQ